MKIVQSAPLQPYWDLLVTHLKVNNDARWVLNDQNLPNKRELVFLVALDVEEVVGSLTLFRQIVVVPQTEWAGERDRVLRDIEGNPFYETFVQTFRVAEMYRRRGIGRALQEEALAITKALGCIQMRSWSSIDAEANYQLKLSLGFGFHPEIQKTPRGLRVSGGYFVKRVD